MQRLQYCCRNMGRSQLRTSGRADDLLCALVVPLALAAVSPGSETAGIATLAVVSAVVCASNYQSLSPMSILGSHSVYVIAFICHQGAGQLARLLLLTSLLLISCEVLVNRGGGSFTGGEAVLVSQVVALVCAASADHLPSLLLFGAPIQTLDRTALIHLLQTSFCWLMVLLMVVTYAPSVRSPVRLHVLLALLAASILVTTSAVINHNCLLWISTFLTRTEQRLRLLTWWSSLLVGSVLFAAALAVSGCVQSSLCGASGECCSCGGQRCGRWRPVMRKLFHALASAVFVSGLLYDPELLLAASGGLTFIFIVAEVVRACDLQPWSAVMRAWFQPFLDSKDTGTLVLSNIYLLVSLAGPLWFWASSASPASSAHDLCLFAGVITVGVGDAAAAVVGSWLGRHHWPGSEKTLEGSVASAGAQLAFCFLLSHTGGVWIGAETWWPLSVAIAATTLTEAFTGQADNLVLPPLFIAVFRMSAVWM